MKPIYLAGITPEDLTSLIGQTVENKLLQVMQQFQPVQTELLTRNEVATLLGVSLPTLRDYTISGKLKGYRIGSRVRYKRAEVETALQTIKTR